MKTDDTGLLEGPEMDALRELRADVEGPSDIQHQAAWERVQGARSQAGSRAKGGGRPWIVGTVAAVAAGVVAVGVGVATLGGGEDQPAPPAGSDSSQGTPTNPNPTPFVTGSVWEAQSAADKKIMDTYRAENIHLTKDGGVRIDIPKSFDWEPMSRALNAEGIPIRFWAQQGKKGEWETAPEYPIDPEHGIDTSKEPSGTPYPMDRITAEYVDGPGSDLKSLTFDEIPTEPVDITFTQ